MIPLKITASIRKPRLDNSARHNPCICFIVILSSDGTRPTILVAKKCHLDEHLIVVTGLSFLYRLACSGLFGTDVKKLKETRNVPGLILAL